MSGGRASRELGPGVASGAIASVLRLRSLVAGAARLGIGGDELAGLLEVPKSTLAADALADPDGRVPSSLLLQLWSYLYSRCPDESFGFWLAEQLQAPPLSLATWVISSSPTLGQGFERALRYQRRWHDEAHSELVISAEEAAYRHQIGAPPFRAPSAAIEFGFVSFLQLARRLTGRAIVPAPLAACSPSAARRDSALRAVRPRPRVCGRARRTGARSTTLALPVFGSEPTLARIVEGHAEAALDRLPASNALSARVRAQINELLVQGTPSVEAVCERLRLSRRTLQRQLSADGKR